MTQPLRLFVTAPLHTGAAVALTPEQAHYAGTVMRRRTDDPLLLFNGCDGEWEARLTGLSRKGATAAVEAHRREQAAEPDIWLAFAPLKRDATDLLVQKATELGVAVLLPVLTERTNAARVNEGRLSAIAIEAAEQSERLTVPEIRAPVALPRLIDAWPQGRILFAAIERAAASPVPPRAGPAGLLVGPEGGFSPGESGMLSRRPGVVPVSLGPRILRAETACLAGLVLLQAGGYG